MSYTCVQTCDKSFPRPRGLRKHQADCTLFKRKSSEAKQLRQQMGSGGYGQVTSTDKRALQIQAALRRRAERDQQQSPVHAPCFIPEPVIELHDGAQASQPFAVPSMPSEPVFMSPTTPKPVFDIPSPPEPMSEQETTQQEQTLLLPLAQEGRPQRTRRLPARFRDDLPEAPTAVEPLPIAQSRIRRVILHVRDQFVTACNAFGLWREFPHRPTYDPDGFVSLADLSNERHHSAREELQAQADHFPLLTQLAPPWPYLNKTVHLLMSFWHGGSLLGSESTLNDLVHKVIQHPDFKVDELDGFNARRENQRLEDAVDTSDLAAQMQFKETSIKIDVPTGLPTDTPMKFSVPGFYYRKLTSVIKAAFQDPLAHQHHYSPFKLNHRCSRTGQEQRVRSEVYNSDAFIEENNKVQFHTPPPPDEPTCTREKVVAAVMFASDSTHLANFGTASAWPVYLMLGNLTKYVRCQPGSGALHHVAYIPSLPDSFEDFASQVHEKWRTQHAAILTHCRRELMQGVWRLLLDDDFLHAYQYGMVIMCIDGIERRVYPRIFTYSADYPEKVLLATIRDKGLCPCPRCLVLKSETDNLGTRTDTRTRVTKIRTYLADKIQIARNAIYRLARPITGNYVEGHLKASSSVPTSNAFVERLGPQFSPFGMLVVDLLHEFELGVWKTLFTHLIRLLHAAAPGGALVTELNTRYRYISTFGNGTIRRFARNASEMKKMAARDFEDLLQCSIPVFEDLLPEPHNAQLMKLLYRTAEWHALAKLRMQTDTTLSLLEQLTTEFGKLMRKFRDTTCADFNTVELPSESRARGRRQARKRRAPTTQAASATDSPPTPEAPAINTGAILNATASLEPTPSASNSASSSRTHSKKLNISTYKFHALGDYVSTIRRFGSTDNYSTQLGETAHRLVKKLYRTTNKRNATKQIAKKYTYHHVLRQARKEVKDAPWDIHYYISPSTSNSLDLFSFAHDADPAKKNFIRNLKFHLLNRLLGRDFDGDYEDSLGHDDLNTVRIINNRIYSAQVFRVNYTTYDIRRDYDVISIARHPFVMMNSPETGPAAHPYWYAQVIGIFSAQVQHVGIQSTNTKPQKMPFLWVRWLGVEPGYRAGHRYAKLPQVGFVPETDDSPFGFLDPDLIVRGAHLIPTFSRGRTNTLFEATQATVARKNGETDDWLNYHVNIFVDRDMYLRYLGGGIGHSLPIDGTGQREPASDDESDIEMDDGRQQHQDEISGGLGHDEPEDNDDENDEESQEDDGDEDEDEDSELGSNEEDGEDDSSGDEDNDDIGFDAP